MAYSKMTMNNNQLPVGLPMMNTQIDMGIQMIDKSSMIPLNTRKTKNHLCNVDGCGKSFDSRWALNRHMRSHSGEKPFRCPYEGCMKAFAEKSAMTRHFKTHSPERPYQCTYEGCGKSFKSKEYLENHIRLHEEGNPYQCKYPGCGKNFCSPKSLRKHIRTWHESDGKGNNFEQQLRDKFAKAQKKYKDRITKLENNYKVATEQIRQLKNENGELKKRMLRCNQTCCEGINTKKFKKDEDLSDCQNDMEQYTHTTLTAPQLTAFSNYLQQTNTGIEPLPQNGPTETGILLGCGNPVLRL